MSRSNSDYARRPEVLIRKVSAHIPPTHTHTHIHTVVLPRALLPGKKDKGFLFHCSLLPTMCLVP